METDKIFIEEFANVAGVRLQIRRGGTGPPLLVLHGELGVPGWLEAYEDLAKDFTVYVPSLPGYGQSPAPDWLMTVRDMSVWVRWFVREYGLKVPLNVVGFSLGAWIAVEMALSDPGVFKKMILVGAMGLKPVKGEIFDYFMNSPEEAFVRSFHEPKRVPEFVKYYGREWVFEENEQIELNREMTSRLTWRPYMHSLTLRGLLPAIITPTLLVWGKQDSIVPVDCCFQYQKAIPYTDIEIIENCGHMVEMEKTTEFTDLVKNFLNYK